MELGIVLLQGERGLVESLRRSLTDETSYESNITPLYEPEISAVTRLQWSFNPINGIEGERYPLQNPLRRSGTNENR
jgi:hypothetical protein